MMKFALVGVSGVVVNFLCYRLFVAVPGWSIWAAASGAAGLAMVNNFIWNEKFTFWETHKAAPDWGHILQRFLAFTVFSTAGLLLNVGLVSLLVGRLGVPWVPGLIAGTGLAALWNFFANSNLTGQARSILLVVTGGKSSDEAAVWEYGGADRSAAAADWIGAAAGKRIRRNQGKTERCRRNRFKIRQLLVFLYPEGARLAPSWAAGVARHGKDEKKVRADSIGCMLFGA